MSLDAVRNVALIFFFLSFSSLAFCQNDSIVFENHNIIVGEIKGMDRNTLTIETTYSDSDFKIEWDKVVYISTESFFLITLTNSTQYLGSIHSIDSSLVYILNEDTDTIKTNVENIVFLDELEKGFWSKLYASVDAGFDITKANSFIQYSVRTNIGYLADKWYIDATYNGLHSKQNDADAIDRQDASLNYKYRLPKDWFFTTYTTASSNSEQKLDLRLTGNLGLGFFLIHSNYIFWDVSIGGSYNNEEYYNTSENRSSWESFFSTDLNMFNMGDLDMRVQIKFTPAFRNDRVRNEVNIDFKYDLPFEFYIKLGTNYNYDSAPVEGTSNVDYAIHTGFGWEW